MKEGITLDKMYNLSNININEVVYNIIANTNDGKQDNQEYVAEQVEKLKKGIYYPSMNLPIMVNDMIYGRLLKDREKNHIENKLQGTTKINIIHIRVSEDAIGIFSLSNQTLLSYTSLSHLKEQEGYDRMFDKDKRYTITTNRMNNIRVKVQEVEGDYESYSCEEIMRYYRNVMLGDYTGREIKLVYQGLGERKEIDIQDITDKQVLERLEVLKERLIEPTKLYNVQVKQKEQERLLSKSEKQKNLLEHKLNVQEQQVEVLRNKIKELEQANSELQEQLHEQKKVNKNLEKTNKEQKEDKLKMEGLLEQERERQEKYKVHDVAKEQKENETKIKRQYIFGMQQEIDGYKPLKSCYEKMKLKGNVDNNILYFLERMLNMLEERHEGKKPKKGLVKQSILNLQRYIEGLQDEQEKSMLYYALKKASDIFVSAKYSNAMYFSRMLKDIDKGQFDMCLLYYVDTNAQLVKLIQKYYEGTNEELKAEIAYVQDKYSKHRLMEIYRTTKLPNEVLYYAKSCNEENVQEFCSLIRSEGLIERYGEDILLVLMNRCTQGFEEGVTKYIQARMYFK